MNKFKSSSIVLIMCSILAVLPPIVDAYSVYYFENTDSPNVFWVDMSKLNFTKGACEISLGGNKTRRYHYQQIYWNPSLRAESSPQIFLIT
jgi:hypothetical protein